MNRACSNNLATYVKELQRRGRRGTAQRLMDLSIEEVSGVDAPANDGIGGWFVMKEAGSEIDLEPAAITPSDIVIELKRMVDDRCARTGETPDAAWTRVLASPVGKSLGNRYQAMAIAPPAAAPTAPDRAVVAAAIERVAEEQHSGLSTAEAVVRYLATSEGEKAYQVYRRL